MRLAKETKAISTIILIILVLCSVIFGAFISYLWVMSSYYNMPENTTLLIVTDVAFPGPPAINLTYFNVTILNPSNSISDANITEMHLSVEGENELYNITETEPEPLPFLIKRGTQQKFKCKTNWSNFAGETVRIEPVAANVSTKSYSCITPKLKLEVTPTFDASKSVQHFNLTIENSGDYNLTISNITLFEWSINQNVTPSLTPPPVLSPGQGQTFKCDFNWENLIQVNISIAIKTLEGYETVCASGALSGATIDIEEVRFDYMDVNHFYVTLHSSESSNAEVTISGVNLTLEDETRIVINHTLPPIGEPSAFNVVPVNQSKTFECTWNWAEYRDKLVTFKVYTNEGHTIYNKTEKTPPAIVFNVTDVKFDFDDTMYFLVNVTNMLCSLQDINVTKIMFSENETVVDSPVAIPPGQQKIINCSISWKDWINKTVVITAFTKDGLNVSRTVEISPVGLKLLGDYAPAYGDLRDPSVNITVPYFNVTISNPVNSIQNVNITSIVFETGNETYAIDGTLTNPKIAQNGYILSVGETITIVCFWDYTLLAETIKVTIYTAEGFQVSRTWLHPS